MERSSPEQEPDPFLDPVREINAMGLSDPRYETAGLAELYGVIGEELEAEPPMTLRALLMLKARSNLQIELDRRLGWLL